MSESQSIHPFVARLYEIARRNDRAALASLRRSLTEDTGASAYPIVAPFFGQKSSKTYEDALLLVAGLFALHPAPGERSLAAALRKLKEKGSDSIEGRFVALLNAHADDVAEHMRHAVTLVRSGDITIDWDDLLRTLLRWEAEWPRRAWARDFWGSNPTDEQQSSTQETQP